jgi:3-oxoacyl-[acyl-carrier protein] reductase
VIKLLEGKNILITGSNRGIGKATVEFCAKQGANIWAHARSASDDFAQFCQHVAEQHQVTITPLYFDLRDKDQMLVAVKLIKASPFPINGLINNAGITYNAIFQMTNEHNIEQNLQVNFVSHYLMTQYIIKLMSRHGGGSIVSIASTAAIDANPGRSAYGSSKAALLCATKALSREVGQMNIRANTVAPGITQTDMLSSMSDEVIAEAAASTALRRCGTPQEIASVAGYLISDHSAYITGQVLRVDGGM